MWHTKRQRDEVLRTAEAILEKAQAAGRPCTPQERTEIKGLIAQAEDINDQFKIAEKIERMRGGGGAKAAAPHGFTKSMLAEFATAAAAGEPIRAKATVDSTGAGVTGEYSSTLITALSEPFRFRSLFKEEQTDAPSVHYRRITTAASQAAAVAEGQLKPEATIAATQVEAPIRKLASYLPVSEEVVDDGGPSFVKQLMDDLIRDLVRVENAQLISGDGVSPNLTGILSTTGIGTRARGTDSNADAVIRAIGQLRQAFMEPTDVLLNPVNFEAIRLAKSSAGEYLFDPLERGQPTILGARVHVSTDAPAGTGLVLNRHELAVVFNRQPLTIEATDSHLDQFQRNIRAFRIEERLAFAVQRPSAAVSVTGLN